MIWINKISKEKKANYSPELIIDNAPISFDEFESSSIQNLEENYNNENQIEPQHPFSFDANEDSSIFLL